MWNLRRFVGSHGKLIKVILIRLHHRAEDTVYAAGKDEIPEEESKQYFAALTWDQPGQSY